MANRLQEKLNGHQIALIHERTTFYSTTNFEDQGQMFHFRGVDNVLMWINKNNVEKITYIPDRGLYRFSVVEHAIVYCEIEFIEAKMISCKLQDYKRNTEYSKIFPITSIQGIKETGTVDEDQEQEN